MRHVLNIFPYINVIIIAKKNLGRGGPTSNTEAAAAARLPTRKSRPHTEILSFDDVRCYALQYTCLTPNLWDGNKQRVTEC